MLRYDIINAIANKNKAQKYLEIGVNYGQCFQFINIEDKDAVDPEPLSEHTNFRITSDKFFDYLNPNIKYDVIFIDGLHTYDQSYKDFINSYKHLNNGGFILFHDTNPPTKQHASDSWISGDWNGTVYKTIMKLKADWPGLTLFTVNTDWGVSVLQKGFQKTMSIREEDYNFEFFDQNRIEILNLISIDEFIAWSKT